MIIATIPTSFRHVLLAIETPGYLIYPEFRGVVIFLPHAPLALLMLVTLLHLAVNGEFRIQATEVLAKFVRRGGVWWFALISWMALSFIWAAEPVLVAYYTAHLALSLVLMLTIIWLVNKDHSQIVLLMYIAAAGIHGTIALAQGIHGGALGLKILGEPVWATGNLFNFPEPVFRAYGLAVHANNLAAYLSIGLFAATLVITEDSSGSWLKWLVLPGGLLAGLGMLATLSRVVIIATVMGLTPPALMLLSSRRHVTKRTVTVISLAAFTGLVVMLLFFGKELWERIYSLSDLPSAANRVFLFFPETTAVIKSNLLLGVGGGNLMTAIARTTANSASATQLVLPAHNVFWVVLAELGIVGLILYVLCLIQPITRLHPRHGKAQVTLGYGLLAIYVMMVFDYYFWGDLRSQLILISTTGLWWGYHLSA